MAGTLSATPVVDRLEKAVEESDVTMVEQLLKELSTTSSHKDTSDILADITPVAKEVLSKLKADRSMLKDPADFTKAAFGSLGGMVSAYWLIYNVYRQYKQNKFWSSKPWWEKSLLGGASAMGTFLGGYYAYKGLTCTSQSKHIARARKVKNMLIAEHEGKN